MTDQHEGDEEQRLSLAVLDALASSAPIGHMLLDCDGRYLRVNDAMLAMNGGTREQRLGRLITDVHPDIGPAVARMVAAVCRTGRPLLQQRLEGEVATRPGERRVWRLSTYPVRVPGEPVAAAGVICEDVTDSERMATRLDVLQRVTAALLATVTVDDCVGVLLEVVPGLIGAASASVILGTAKDPTARVAGAGGAGAPVQWSTAPSLSCLPAGAGPAGVRWLGSSAEWAGALPGCPAPPGAAWALVGLVTPRGPLGLLVLGYHGSPPGDPAVRALVEAVAEQSAVALERAVLYEQAEAARRRTLCLQRATAELARATTEEEIATVVFEGARTGVGAVSGGLGLVDAARRVHRLVATFGWDHLAASDLLADRPLDAPSLSTTAIGRGEPLFVTSPEELASLMPPDRARRLVDSHQQAWAVVPLGAPGAWIGTMSCSFPRTYRFDEDERAFLGTLAGQATQALDRIRRHRAEHQVAVVLQRALLPERIPTVPGLAVAVRYRAGAGDVQVGGDWYDVFRLPDGSVALTVGDVAGHDLAAAGTMGRLRAQVRACAHAVNRPGPALAALDRLVHAAEEEDLATVVLAVWRPGADALAVAAAGHPPPLVVDADGARFVPTSAGPPIGADVTPASYPEQRVSIPTGGATLVFYSDGLVERRDRSMEEGMAELRATATGRLDPHDLADDLVAQLEPPQGWEDDVALLVCRLAGLG